MNGFALPLFVYGPLRDTDLLAVVLGRPLRMGTLHPAHAPGFKAVYRPNRVSAALVRSPGAAAQGLLIAGLTAFERDLLDAYEGNEYRRTTIAAMLADEPELHEVDTHLPLVRVPTDAHDWSLSRWQQQHKPRVLVTDAGEAARLRERLVAIRPN